MKHFKKFLFVIIAAILIKISFLLYFGYVNQKFFVAIDSGSIDEVHRLINMGADVNAVERNGILNAIVHAIKKNDANILKLLISKGADVNAKMYLTYSMLSKVKNFLGLQLINYEYRRPINFAVTTKNIELVKILIENGAEINDCFILYSAAMSSNVEIFKYLIEKGAKACPIIEPFRTSPLHSAILGDNYEIALLMAGNKSLLNFKNSLGQTPLLMAMKLYVTKKNDLVKLLIKSGTDVNISDGNYTPLIIGIANFDTETVKLIIDAGADINMKDGYQETPLIFSAKNKKWEFFKMLVKAGADTNLADSSNITPLMQCVYNRADTENIQLLINNNANINCKNEYGDTPLIRASWLGYDEIVRLLIDAGADVGTKNKKGIDALSAAKNKNIKKMLTEHR